MTICTRRTLFVRRASKPRVGIGVCPVGTGAIAREARTCKIERSQRAASKSIRRVIHTCSPAFQKSSEVVGIALAATVCEFKASLLLAIKVVSTGGSFARTGIFR